MPRPSVDWTIETIRRFCEDNANGCWEWQRGKSASGYGTIRFCGVATAAHRVAWICTNGPIPDGLCVLHRCDNRPCCNPAHLFLGTQHDNIADMDSKGRRTVLRGEFNGASKLSADGVRLVRALCKYGFSQDDVGRLFRIPQGYVSNIMRRRVWAHVD